MKFYLGTHRPTWLTRTEVPLFISYRLLAPRRSLPRASGRWALDSGGFTELSMFGKWGTPPAEYARQVRRLHDEIGGLDWIAPQDWMCEPTMLDKTGLTITEHQVRTVGNYLDLREHEPGLPFVPVLQGWSLDDYLTCIGLYMDSGVDLSAEPTVGLGSVCRRQSEQEIETICSELAGLGLRLHGFGVKTSGMRYARHLASADSMAWSYNARRNPPIEGHPHKNCANCIDWALRWRRRVLERAEAAAFTERRRSRV